MKFLRLFAASLAISLQRGLAFRADLFFQILLTAVGLGSGLATLGVVYSQTTALGGWNLGEAVVLLGTYQIVSGLRAAFIEPNVVWFAGQVKAGKLDDLLLKPVSSLYLSSLGACAPLALAQVVVGGLVLVGGLRSLDAAPTLLGVAGWLVLLSAGIVITWASRVLVASLALWLPGVDLDVVYGALWQFGRYPVTIYRQPMRFVLTYALPVAFISTFPALALTRRADPAVIAAGLAVALIAVALVQVVWNAGLRRYTSATS